MGSALGLEFMHCNDHPYRMLRSHEKLDRRSAAAQVVLQDA